MKLIQLIPLAAPLASAIILPNEEMMQELASNQKSFFDRLPKTDGLSNFVKDRLTDRFPYPYTGALRVSDNPIDNAIDAGTEKLKALQDGFPRINVGAEAWLDSAMFSGQSHHGHEDDDDEFATESWPHWGHHPHHPKRSNLTLYELISESKYTTKLAKLVNKYDDLVKALNSTSANVTLFAPTDEAFKKFENLPEDHRPSDETIKKALEYHISPHVLPAPKLLHHHTVPSALKLESLGDHAQRIRVGLNLHGVVLNFYSRVVAADIFGANGVIHGVSSILIPPPPALKLIEILPGEFSTLSLGLEKTGLAEAIAHANHQGGTIFAPSNFAFKLLGPKANAFLFSEHGKKYLKALLEYHVVANETLYSDAFYKLKKHRDDKDKDAKAKHERDIHVDLPTLLHGKHLSVDITGHGLLRSVRINGFTHVSVQDGIAKDGVIQVVPRVLIPPRTPAAMRLDAGEEVSVEELMASLDVDDPWRRFDL